MQKNIINIKVFIIYWFQNISIFKLHINFFIWVSFTYSFRTYSVCIKCNDQIWGKIYYIADITIKILKTKILCRRHTSANELSMLGWRPGTPFTKRPSSRFNLTEWPMLDEAALTSATVLWRCPLKDVFTWETGKSRKRQI